MLLKENNLKIKSFKWNNFKTFDKVYVLKEFLDFLFEYMHSGKVYVLVLIWDTYDKRHAVEHRDDTKNLSLMYFKAIKFLANKNICDGKLIIVPDQNDAINWEEISEILCNDNVLNYKKLDSKFHILIGQQKVFFNESTPTENSLIQIADIFAGMGRTSYEEYDIYDNWLDQAQQTLIPVRNPSNKNIKRFEIIKYVNDWAKINKLGVSLRTKRGFYSYNPHCPLNFWFYTPQHEKDKAPTK